MFVALILRVRYLANHSGTGDLSIYTSEVHTSLQNGFFGIYWDWIPYPPIYFGILNLMGLY
jgi:hypothetical protein